MADGFLRGIASIALGHYNATARSLKRGLLLKPIGRPPIFNWARCTRIMPWPRRRISRHWPKKPLESASSDILFLLGVMLYFDVERDPPPIFLRTARQILAAGDDAHLDGFPA